MATTTTLPSGSQTASSTKPPTTFMSLPPEVRHKIYRHLFCHCPSPIWLGTRYSSATTPSFSFSTTSTLLPSPEPSEPTFHTQTFRISRTISTDALIFAYSANPFVLRDTFPAFCALSATAKAAIADLTVTHSTWTAAYAKEDVAWNDIRTLCTGLRTLELDLHADLLLEAVRYLPAFFASLSPSGPIPRLALDLYVWERHFSFEDSRDRDFARSLALLRGNHVKTASTPKFLAPRERVMRLPPTAREIVLSTDVNAGTVAALDVFLEQMRDEVKLVRIGQKLPGAGRRAYGRSERVSYLWQDEEGAGALGLGNMLEGTGREPIVVKGI